MLTNVVTNLSPGVFNFSTLTKSFKPRDCEKMVQDIVCNGIRAGVTVGFSVHNMNDVA